MHSLSTEVYLIAQKWQDGKDDREYDRSIAGEERYATMWAGCEGGERNVMKSLRPPCCTV